LLLLAPLLAASPLWARIRFVPASVKIATADAIVIGTAKRFHVGKAVDPHEVSFSVHRYLRGVGPRGELRVRLPIGSELEEATGARASRPCTQLVASAAADQAEDELVRIQIVGGSAPTIRCRNRYVLFLGQGADGGFKLQSAVDASDRQQVRALRALLPKVPSWGEPTQGLAAIIVTDTPRVALGDDIDVSMGVKNLGDTPIELHVGGGRQQRSHFTLDIRGPAGKQVEPQPHPSLTASSFAEFFAHQSRARTFTLQPGESTFLPRESINSAEAGWGYKEDLDFQFYPMRSRGRYRIVGTAQRFLLDAEPRSMPLYVVID